MILVCAVRMGGFVGDVRAGCFASCSESPHGAHASEDSRESQAPCESAWSIRAARPRAGARWALGWQWRALVPSVRGGVGCRSTPLPSSVLSCAVSCRVVSH